MNDLRTMTVLAVVIMVVLVVGVVRGAHLLQEQADACKLRGGTIVNTHEGPMCLQVKKV